MSVDPLDPWAGVAQYDGTYFESSPLGGRVQSKARVYLASQVDRARAATASELRDAHQLFDELRSEIVALREDIVRLKVDAQSRSDELAVLHVENARMRREIERLTQEPFRLTQELWQSRTDREALAGALVDAGIVETDGVLRWVFEPGVREVSSSGGTSRQRLLGLLQQVRYLVNDLASFARRA